MRLLAWVLAVVLAVAGLGLIVAAFPAAGQDPGGPAPEASSRLDLQRLLDQPLGWREILARVQLKLVDFVPQLLAALVILLAFVALYRVTARILEGVVRRTGSDPALRSIGLRLARYGILGLGLLVAANQVGFAVGSLLAGLGIFGLAVGFAAQDTLANLIAGLTILWDRPFRTGDNVTIAGTFGRVTEIGLRSTRLRTIEQRDAILPNKDVISQMIVNHTLTPQSRVRVAVGIAYREDPRRAREVLLRCAREDPAVMAEPPPEVIVTELAESSVNLELRAWVGDPFREAEVRWRLLESVKLALDAAGIEIPFPQRTVHLVPPAGPTAPADPADPAVS
jgi:small conductance mechanosensitive channel